MVNPALIASSLENSHAELVLFRTLYCASLALVTAVKWREHRRFLRQAGRDRSTPDLFGCVAMPKFGPDVSGVIGIGLVGSLVAAAVGLMPVFTLGCASLGTLLYHAQVVDLPGVRRKPSGAGVILLLLAAASMSGTDSAGAVSLGCIITIKLVVAQMYFSSGLTKIRLAGVRWGDGQTLRTLMIEYYFFYRKSAALWLASCPSLCRIFSTGVILFELSFWLIIPLPALAWVYLPLGIAFHVATAFLMRINYFVYTMPAYVIFTLPWIGPLWRRFWAFALDSC